MISNSGPYYLDQASSKDKKPDNISEGITTALNITAGLMYLQQFIDTIAFYVDVTLPKKISPRDFWGELDEPAFHKKVARLNYNVLYLCLSQNIPKSELHPFHAVANILKLYERNKTSFTSDDFISALNEQSDNDNDFNCEALIDYSDSDDDEDTISSDWETVPTPESVYPSGNAGYYSASPRRSSFGIMSSAMSFVREFVGQK